MFATLILEHDFTPLTANPRSILFLRPPFWSSASIANLCRAR